MASPLRERRTTLKRLLSFILAVLLALPLTCSIALAEESRPVLTIGDISDRSDRRISGENQMGMWRYLEDQLGVEIEFVYLPPEVYASGLANGNLPDIVATNNNLSTILENGVALNVDPYLEEYVPNFLQGDTRVAYDVFKQLYSDEDGFYFFPQKIGYNGVGYTNGPANRGYVVRWDYYKELGYPPINNEDDYLKVLQQMHANHPFTEEGYPTYLLGTNNLSGYATAFRAELSLDYWAAYKYQNNIFTNEVYDGYTDTEHSMWWTSMAWYNKLYHAGRADGSFDMEFLTQTNEQFDAKCNRGQYMGLLTGKESVYEEHVKTDPDTLTGYGLVPTSATNLYTNVYQLLGNGSRYMWFISANTQHKEAALRLFNYMCDPDFLREANMGQQGVTWEYDAEGVPQMTKYGQEQFAEFAAGNPPADNYYVKWGTYNELSANWPLLRDNMMHPDGYPLDFLRINRDYAMDTMTNNISLDMCEHYGVELPSDAHYKAGGLDFRNDCGEAISSCMSSLDRNQLHVLEGAEAILAEVQVDLILAETDEEFEAIKNEAIQRLIDLGEPEVFAAYKQKWDAAADIIVPLVQKAQIENGIEPYTPEQYERDL